jgi:hypothetical protein
MTENKLVAVNKLQSSTFWVIVVFAMSLISRLIIILIYQPISYSDTPSYRRLAEAVIGGFANYDGTRTPGYPVFLALVGSDQHVWIVQLLLGIATTLLLFYIGWKLTDKPWFGGLIALSHTLNLSQLFFESNLLTESLTTFLIVLTMAGMLIWLVYPNKRSLWLAFFIGLVSVMTILVRPLFIYLPFYLLVFLWIGIKQKYSPTNIAREADNQVQKGQTIIYHHPLQYVIAFSLPVVLLLGGWISFIHIHFGDWSLTTMTGYHLIQHTGGFFEYVPNEYASLRDTYIRYRDAHIAKYGTQTNTIWDAIPEMSRVSGYNFYDLSNVLTHISIQLILKHPFLFVKSAITGWWMFWHPSVYWSADSLHFSWLAGGLNIVIQIQRVILFFVNLIFIFSSLYFVLSKYIATLRHKLFTLHIRFVNHGQQAYFWLLLGTIWAASILQTLLDHGDNPRFLIPLQSLVVLWIALFVFQLFQIKRASLHATPPPT